MIDEVVAPWADRVRPDQYSEHAALLLLPAVDNWRALHARLDGFVSGIALDQFPDLVPQLLPVMNEITGLLVRHDFGALVFQDCYHCARIRSVGFQLPASGGFQRVCNAIEFDIHLCPDPLRPFDLINSARQ